MQTLRVGLVAGEPSGDLLGAGVIAALRERCADVHVEGVGGPAMAGQGLASLYPMERLSVMGLVEPLRRLPELLRLRRALARRFAAAAPDVFLGIDSPDFTLGLERRLRRRGVTTAHLVSPSVWAWRRGRLRGIARGTDLMLCLFPFETGVYREHGIPVEFVGHPLADEIPEAVDRGAARARLGLAGADRLVALLPGSRGGEVARLAPLFLQTAARLYGSDPALRFVLPAANAARERQLQPLVAASGLPVTLCTGQARDAMAAADAVLVASGTATLEAALLRRPMVVAYRMSGLSWFGLSRLVDTPWVALPNLLARQPLVPEFLQREATPAALAAALGDILAGRSADTAAAFAAMHEQLRHDCAARVADALLRLCGRSGD